MRRIITAHVLRRSRPSSSVCTLVVLIIVSLVTGTLEAAQRSAPWITKDQQQQSAFAILQSDVFIVPDASQDARFSQNPLVACEPKIRFYAGATLVVDGHPLGTLCVIDRVPRELLPQQLEALRALSRQVRAQLELRRNLKRLDKSLAARDRAEAEKDRALQELKAALAKINTLEGLLPICLSCKKIQDQTGSLQVFEYYLRAHSQAKVTHKPCPDCSKAISA